MKYMKYQIIIAYFLALTLVQADDSITLGLIASSTGYGAAAGQSTVNGAILAVDEINQSGGIKGKKVFLKSEDNRSEPKQSITAYKKLRTLDNIKFLVGPNWTEFSEPLASVADNDKVVMITPTGHTPTLVKDRPFVFSLQFPARKAVLSLTNFIISKNFDEVHIIYSSNAYYEMISEAVYDNLKDKVKTTKELAQSDSLDYKSSILKIKNKKNIAVVALLLENGPVSTFVKQAKNIGIQADHIFLGPVFRDDEILKNDKSLSQDLIYFDYIFSIPETFEAKFRQKFNYPARYDSTLSYDAVFLIKKAIEECGDQTDKTITCINQGLKNAQSGEIKFDQNKDRIMTTPITGVFQIKDGKPMQLL